MPHHTTVAELMTPRPVTVSPADSVQRAAQLMDELNVGALPVCEGTRLAGIVTDRDITVRATAAGLDPARTPVDLVMTDHVRSCQSRHSPDAVLQQMAQVQIRRLPVLDDAGLLVGMVALGDLAVRQRRLGPAVETALRAISIPAEPDRVERAAA